MPEYAIELENGLTLCIVGPQNAIDRVEHLVKENERLKVELEQCQQTLYRQIGLTIEASEEATKASATEIERLRAALREIDQQRYTGRHTINLENAYERAVALNEKMLTVMDIARAALKENGDG